MNVKVFDSHCHLQDDAFSEDVEEVFHRAELEGIGLIVPGYTMESSEKAIEFCRQHAQSWALVGVHPHDSKDWTANDVETMKNWLKRPRVVGIGEIGLDYHYNNSPPDVQRRVFQTQMTLARDLNIPVSVHTREAEDDTLHILQEVGHHQGVIHCFTGSEEFAQAILSLGWYISFSGAITFKSAHSLRGIVQNVPMNRILIETDSPYLSPVPWRGQRNEPLRVIRVAEVVAAQKNCSTEEVFRHTTANILTLFSLS